MDELRPEVRRRTVSGGPLDGKPFAVSGYEVWRAWEQVRDNKGAPGADGQSVAAFEERLEDNLYRVWNRMSSGTWFPPPVRAAVIPKPGGGTRTEKAVVLCAAGKSGIQALDRSQPVLPMMPGMPERRTHDYARNGVTSLFAAFNIADGTVIGELHRRHRAVEFLRFLRKIDKAVPAGLDVHLVCDNLATHKTPEVQQWLARRPRFHVHFTPTGSSWINQAGRWFGYLTDQMLRRGARKSVQALEADIRAWIDTWNENPRAFTWTKSAKEILSSLAEYITRISGEAH